MQQQEEQLSMLIRLVETQTQRQESIAGELMQQLESFSGRMEGQVHAVQSHCQELEGRVGALERDSCKLQGAEERHLLWSYS